MLWRRRQQMMAQAKRRKASWMSSRISHRMRSRRNQCSRAKPCSTTQRYTPSPESCCSPRRAMTGLIPASIGVERIRTLGAGCPSAGSQAGGQVAQDRGGHIDAGRVDKHAEAPGWTGDVGLEPVYQELLHVRTPTPTSNTRPRTQVGKGSLTGMRRMVTRSAWYPESAADQSAPHRPGHAVDADPR